MKEIVIPLLDWFKKNKRDLDWRKNPTPYTVLISEVMLQQTRVETVRSYYKNFIEALPNLKALAECPEEKLLKLWEGLGYYSRARNLKKCAIQIMNQYDGVFPKDYRKALELPGVGMYTCGAILSIAYHQKYAAVDGNVLRVLTRYTACSSNILLDKTKQYFKNKIEEILPEDAGGFNESLMALGATICMPKVVRCDICPIHRNCKAYQTNTIQSFPNKAKPKEKRIFEYTCLFVTDGKHYILLPKEDNVLKGMASPFLVDRFLSSNDAADFLEEHQFSVLHIVNLNDKKHIFTHQIWYMKGYLVFVRDLLSYPKYTKEQIQNQISIPICFKKFIDEINLN